MDKTRDEEKVTKARKYLIKGQIGEIYTKFLLKEKGYRILSLNKNNLFSNRLFYFLDKIENRERIIQLLQENSGIPDFICKREDKIIFVETKTNNSNLSKHQLIFFKELNKEFPIFIWNISFDFELKGSEVKECDKEYLKVAEEKFRVYESYRKK